MCPKMNLNFTRSKKPHLPFADRRRKGPPVGGNSNRLFCLCVESIRTVVQTVSLVCVWVGWCGRRDSGFERLNLCQLRPFFFRTITLGCASSICGLLLEALKGRGRASMIPIVTKFDGILPDFALIRPSPYLASRRKTILRKTVLRQSLTR